MEGREGVIEPYVGGNIPPSSVLHTQSITPPSLPPLQAFFSRWWYEQTPKKKAQVRRLVEEERLVFT